MTAVNVSLVPGKPLRPDLALIEVVHLERPVVALHDLEPGGAAGPLELEPAKGSSANAHKADSEQHATSNTAVNRD